MPPMRITTTTKKTRAFRVNISGTEETRNPVVPTRWAAGGDTPADAYVAPELVCDRGSQDESHTRETTREITLDVTAEDIDALARNRVGEGIGESLAAVLAPIAHAYTDRAMFALGEGGE